MKLLNFKGSRIRGYMNHNINFRESVTFLIGINGSGKTSVLKLINGLTEPSYRLLESVDYSEIELTFEHDSVIHVIRSEKKENHLLIELVKDGELVNSLEFGRYKDPSHSIELVMDSSDYQLYCDEFLRTPLAKEIASLPTPLFIGINRMPDKDIYNLILRGRRFRSTRKTNFSSVDDSLNVIQDIVFDLFSRNAARQNNYIEAFRSQVLKEALSLITTKSFSASSAPDLLGDMRLLPERKQKFIQALEYAGLEDAETMVTNFFEAQKENLAILTDTTVQDSQKKTNAFINWYVSKIQLDKIDAIIEYGQDYQKKVRSLNTVHKLFVECANMFFTESGKAIEILSNGLIKVSIPYIAENGNTRTHKNDITDLSSGEKQIISMLGSLIFVSPQNKSNVLVIDEPELSLHLTWQEIFVDALLKAQPDSQFILATHSPTIIAKNERRTWCEDLSTKQI